MREMRILHVVIDPSHHTAYAKYMHREEHPIECNEHDPEVYLAQTFIHHTPEHLRIPEIHTRKDCKERTSEEHIM